MALFNKLFTKERCCICGAEVGAMQRKRLTDGVICKECVQSCSPWFDDYKSSSISQLKTQWKMRDANRKVLENSFAPSRRLGDYGAFIFDDANDQFVAFAQVPDEVAKDPSVEHLAKYNPDILKLGTIKSVDFRLEESEHEEKRVTKEGEKVSYDPPRYRYGYNWVITLAMDNAPTVGVPYVKRVRVRRSMSDARASASPTTCSRVGGPFLRSGRPIARLSRRTMTCQRKETCATWSPSLKNRHRGWASCFVGAAQRLSVTIRSVSNPVPRTRMPSLTLPTISRWPSIPWRLWEANRSHGMRWEK